MRGRDAFNGLPKGQMIYANDIYEAIHPLVDQIWNAVISLWDAPPACRGA